MKKVKAIVIADDHYNALGMVRSLGLVQIDITLIMFASKRTYVDASKYVNRCIKISHSTQAVIREVKNVINEYSDSLIALIPLNDFAAQVLDENSNLFPSNVLCPNAQGQVLRLSDKYYIKSVVKELGFNVPEGIIIDSTNIDSLNWNIFPAIIKPLVSVEGAKSDISIVKSMTELEDEIDRYRKLDYKHALVEEYIDGDDAHMVEVMGARNIDSSIDYAGIISKIREFPIKNGSTSYASIVDKHEGIDIEAISRFLNKINYVGIFDIEYKYANGKAYFIECNFRNGAPGFIFTLNGHNIPALWIEKNLNVKMNVTCTHVTGIDFMVEQNDVINMLKGTPDFFTWIKQYLNACRIFSFKGDLKPVRKYYFNFIGDQLKKRLRK